MVFKFIITIFIVILSTILLSLILYHHYNNKPKQQPPPIPPPSPYPYPDPLPFELLHNLGQYLLTNTKMFLTDKLETTDQRFTATFVNGTLCIFDNINGTTPRKTIISSPRAFYLTAQQDGNLVLYDQFDKYLWDSGTNVWKDQVTVSLVSDKTSSYDGYLCIQDNGKGEGGRIVCY